MEGTVLVADDDRTIRTVLTQALTRAGCRVHATSSLTTLMRWIGEGLGDAVITDVVMPDGNGLEMIPKITQERPGLPVIVISAQNTIMTAIRAEQAAAFDYMPKPFDLPDLLKRTARALTGRQTAQPVEAAPPTESLPLIGRTPVMQGLYRLIARVMDTDLPVLICGPSGTGKSLVARLLHERSQRHMQPFVVAPTGPMERPEDLQQMMAGARGGTVLFEDVAEMSLDRQFQIVKALDGLGADGPRILSTLQGDPAKYVARGALREDLYFRLSAAVLNMPPLRERVADIPVLATAFLERYHDDGVTPRALSEPVLELLRSYDWPGNVRQLENMMRHLCLTGAGQDITVPEVVQILGDQPAPAGSPQQTEKLGQSVERHVQRYFDLHGNMLPPPGLYGRILREVELPLIEIALDATGGNQAKCAELLGINRNTLRKKITNLDIQVTRRRKLM